MKWTPKLGPGLEQQLESIVRDLIGVYAQAETRLVNGMALAVNRGFGQTGDIASLEAELATMRKMAKQTVQELNRLTPALLEQLLDNASKHGLAFALGQLDSIPVPFAITRDVPNAPAVLNLRSEMYSRMVQVNQRILRLPADIYQAAVADSVSGVLILGGTARRGQQAGWQKLLSAGVTGFVDKAGRNWNLSSYVEMASRTAAIRAYHSQAETTMLANGVQLVTIVVGNDSCSECGPWAGRVLAINGVTGPRRVLNPITGVMDQINVEYTLDQAREHGWNHPNCRCSEAAYMPGLEPVVNLNKHDPALEVERNQLRSMERKIRSIKRDVATATTEQDKTYHRKRLRQAQANVRSHVDETGLMRKSYREQPNLGYRK